MVPRIRSVRCGEQLGDEEFCVWDMGEDGVAPDGLAEALTDRDACSIAADDAGDGGQQREAV